MLEQMEFEEGMMPALRPASNYIACSLDEAVKIRADNKSLHELNIQTIPQFFHECCQKYKDLPALAYKSPVADASNSEWTKVSYAEYEQKVEQAALMLLHLGVQPHTSVAILAYNCPEWFYLEMAAFRIGAVVAGIYTTNSTEAVQHVLETSDAAICLVDDAQQMAKVRAAKSCLKKLCSVVQLNGPFDDFVGSEPGYYRWKDLFEMQFSETLSEELLKRERDVAANECPLLIFTTDFDAETGLPLNTLRPDAVQWLQSLDLHYTHLTDLLNISLPESVKNFDPNTVDINCDAKVWQALEEGIKRYNARAISNAQKIQYFSVLPHDFSLPTGELGPTLKIKRSVVEKKYVKTIEKMYKK